MGYTGMLPALARRRATLLPGSQEVAHSVGAAGFDFGQIPVFSMPVQTQRASADADAACPELGEERRARSSAVERIRRTDRFPLTASIRAVAPEHDSGEEGSPDEMADLTIELPIYESWLPEEREGDTIDATLGYSPSVSVSPDEPGDKTDFGTTWGNHVRTAPGGKIHFNSKAKRYEVTQTFENPIVIKVFKDTGPRNQTNIESETDPDIKRGNYSAVAADLKPGKDDRSPRGAYWARDLTLVHEQFHATDGQTFCNAAVASEQAALNQATASSIDEVKDLMRPITGRIISARGTGMTKPASEDRAYAAGSAAYKARADAILATGKAGKYTASIEAPVPNTEESALAVAEPISEQESGPSPEA